MTSLRKTLKDAKVASTGFGFSIFELVRISQNLNNHQSVFQNDVPLWLKGGEIARIETGANAGNIVCQKLRGIATRNLN